MLFTRTLGKCLLPALLTICGGAMADSSPPGAAEAASGDGWAFKLTPSYYSTTHETAAKIGRAHV